MSIFNNNYIFSLIIYLKDSGSFIINAIYNISFQFFKVRLWQFLNW